MLLVKGREGLSSGFTGVVDDFVARDTSLRFLKCLGLANQRQVLVQEVIFCRFSRR
jgi:hypothetical protein